MALWLILFILVVGISFLLALRSMMDYQEVPEQTKVEYGLFLIRQIDNFDANILNAIRNRLHTAGLVISIERLIKGKQAALTIFGLKKILADFTDKLNLLELEDYTASWAGKEVSTWEIGVKDSHYLKHEDFDNIFKNLPEFAEDDQFFLQVVLSPKGNQDNAPFATQIRVAFLAEDSQRKRLLAPLLHNLNTGGLIKVPRPFSLGQMMSFYRARSLSKDSKGPILDSQAVARLLKV
ncbi:hypothetical protein HY383_03465 [Candidatus Daviesbacteria bacterium]|nr:hypothetical protein [Candidatus Daviesbacteria bacterium]